MVESEEVSAGAAKQTQEPSGSVYVVLRRESLSVDLSMTDYRGKESVTVWREIATFSPYLQSCPALRRSLAASVPGNASFQKSCAPAAKAWPALSRPWP